MLCTLNSNLPEVLQCLVYASLQDYHLRTFESIDYLYSVKHVIFVRCLIALVINAARCSQRFLQVMCAKQRRRAPNAVNFLDGFRNVHEALSSYLLISMMSEVFQKSNRQKVCSKIQVFCLLD